MINILQLPLSAAEETEIIDDLGCWKDTSSRAIPTLEKKHPDLKDDYKSRTNAYAKCLKAAKTFGYKVFALQNGGWCASSENAQNTYTKYGMSNDCRHDGEGGPWSNQVYKINGKFRSITVLNAYRYHYFPICYAVANALQKSFP